MPSKSVLEILVHFGGPSERANERYYQQLFDPEEKFLSDSARSLFGVTAFCTSQVWFKKLTQKGPPLVLVVHSASFLVSPQHFDCQG